MTMPAFLKKISSTALHIVLSFCFSFSLVATFMSSSIDRVCPLTVDILDPLYYASIRCSQMTIIMITVSLILSFLIFGIFSELRQRPEKNLYSRVFLMLFVLTLILVIFNGYKNITQSMKYKKTVPIAKTHPSSTPIPTPTIRFVQSTKPGWKTYQGYIYSISFPNDWTFSGPRSGTMGFPEITYITSTTTSTSLLIGLVGDFQAGWGSTDESDRRVFKQEDILVTVGEYEDILVTVGEYEVAGYKQSLTGPIGPFEPPQIATTTFVALSSNQYQYSVKDGTLHPLTFWYGNGYPTVSAETTPKQAMIDFEKEEPVIKEILKTFKFHLDQNIQPTKPDSKDSRISACIQNGGTWRDFPTTCADNCQNKFACGDAITDSCDCGPNKCWDGSSCIKILPIDK